MLKFESVFWAASSGTRKDLEKKLNSLGFTCSPSTLFPGSNSLYFGPEALEIVEADGTKPAGIYGIGLESDNIVEDYKRIQAFTDQKLEKPKIAKDGVEGLPLWTGFNIPDQVTPLLKAWVVMNSPHTLANQASSEIPLLHPNTCFGVEAVHVLGPSKEAVQWGSLLQKHVSGLQWNEQFKGSGKRIQVGERFLDIIESSSPQKNATSAFMVTLKVTDIEQAQSIAQAAGAQPQPCHNRDGFIIPATWTGGPTLRFVRAFWKRYLPVVTNNYPLGRRTDKFRPLGGAYSSTLQNGFEDNWKY